MKKRKKQKIMLLLTLALLLTTVFPTNVSAATKIPIESMQVDVTEIDRKSVV